jgi:eukaryotic-like serine/threonine-protein kinase
MTLSTGMRLGPYEIQSVIGAGGMGEVYRARDSRLERDVALKVLPAATLGDEIARARLVREARLASRLNHPHICTIYDVGETDVSGDSAGSPGAGSGPRSAYIAMELVEGQPLSARVAAGPLPTDQVVRYGQQLADALAHAHARGVVHRDLKSGNVVVTPEGQVKVLDFGLAKRLTEEALAEVTTVAPHSLTAPGMVAGTLAYMAPEQLRGRPADARSDIWALGVVLYEMAAGQRPFVGETGFELTAAIFNKPVPPMPVPVPGPVTGVVERCLAKEPGERYQRAGEVKAALEAVASGRDVARWPTWRMAAWRRRRLLGRAAGAVALIAIVATLIGLDVAGLRSRLTGGAATPAKAIRLAVLPFANLSGDSAQECLGDGITEEMITLLGRLHPTRLEVIGRTSVMRYKKGGAPIDQIGRDLKVDYILEGSAQREANRVRITAKLIRVKDQAPIWSRPYEYELSSIMLVQSELAKSVAEALALTLLPAEEDRLDSARTVNPEAYEAYVKGSSLWKTLKRADLDAAQRYFEQALLKDPSYAQAYQGLTWIWLARQQRKLAPPGEAGPKATEAALQALKLDGNSADAHEALAAVRSWCDWNWTGAEPEWKRALELNPNSANAQAYYAHFLAQRGRVSEAIPHSERALELDPFNALYHGMYAVVLQYARRYDDELAAARKALSFQPDLEIALDGIQRIYLNKGMREEALADQRLRIARDPERLAAFDRGLAEGGYEGAQRAIADVLAARYRTGQYRDPTGISRRYLGAGDRNRAMDWLNTAYEIGDPSLAYLGASVWDPLRADGRFQALLRRIGLPQ